MAAQTYTSGVADRYATALFELADSDGALDRVADDLDRLSRMIDDSNDLRRLVKSPVFAADEQQQAMAAILARAGIAGVVANFVGVVARNRRLFALQDMIKAYRARLAERRGEVTAEVVSARTLSDAQAEQLKSTLKASTGREVQIDTRVDEGLLGGLVVKIGSRMVDTSLRTKLNSLKFAMKEAG